jgi:hypothetical protein
MESMRRHLLIGIVMVVGLGLAPLMSVHAQTASPTAALTGAWSLNKDLSQSPEDKPFDDGDRRERGDRGDRRGGGGGGGFGRGGFGRGGGRGGQRGGDTAAVDPEAAARLRDAMRELRNPPDHLIIVQSGSMVILTGPDGRTTRLSPDGRKIKDESTKIERKTKWDAATLVSEVSGPSGLHLTETYAVDVEHHQLHVTVRSDDDRRKFTLNRVYDADAASR